MFFLPYRVDFHVLRFPFVTLLVALLCIGVFCAQVFEAGHSARMRSGICGGLDTSARMALTNLHIADNCEDSLARLLASKDADADIRSAIAASGGDGGIEGWSEFESDTVHSSLEMLRMATPRAPLTERIDYHPESWNPWRAVTAVFAHGSLMHLMGNLFFFFIFASTVEALLGSLRFALSILLLALGTHYCYSAVTAGTQALPTIGLSGVILGIMGMFAWAMPDARIRTFYWVFLRVGVASLPAWFIVLWYAGFDAWHLYSHAGGNVNLVAHVSGAVLGALMGATIFRGTVERSRGLAPAI